MGTHYSYTCGNCGKYVTGSSKHRTCNYCGMNLCWKCSKGGLCPTHDKALTSREKSKLSTMQFQIGQIAGCMCFVELISLVLMIGSFSDGFIYGLGPLFVFLISTYFTWIHPSIIQKKKNELIQEITHRLGHSKVRMGVGEKFIEKKLGIPGVNLAEGMSKETPKFTFNSPSNVSNINNSPQLNNTSGLCRQCGAALVSGAKFCKQCGAPVIKESSLSQTSPSADYSLFDEENGNLKF